MRFIIKHYTEMSLLIASSVRAVKITRVLDKNDILFSLELQTWLSITNRLQREKIKGNYNGNEVISLS